jgi:hypothetical protein
LFTGAGIEQTVCHLRLCILNSWVKFVYALPLGSQRGS